MNLFSLVKKEYLPLNTIEVSKSALLKNYYYLSQFAPGVMIAPVLKSNAYGHGLGLVSNMLDSVGAPFFCVDSLFEAYELLKNNVKTPILIMGYVHPENLRIRQFPFIFTVYDKEHVAALSKFQKNPKIHIFVETGMNREGIRLSELPELLSFIQKFPRLQVEGVMSHLSAGYNSAATTKQLEQFEKVKKIVFAAGFSPKFFHIASSSGLLHNTDYQGKLGNLARCGIALYGIDLEEDQNLQPVLTLKTTLVQIKALSKGEKVGYDATFTATRKMTIGILPLGFFDGVDRRLSNKGFVSIGDVFCPIVGRVSMNLTTIDISKVKDPHVGDIVIVFSNRSSHKNAFFHSAKLANASPYELLVGLTASSRRIVV